MNASVVDIEEFRQASLGKDPHVAATFLEIEKQLSRQPEKAIVAGGGPPQGTGMEAKVAVLEEIARSTEKLLERMDERMTRIEDRQSRDLKWLIALGLAATFAILGTMAHGFHWL